VYSRAESDYAIGTEIEIKMIEVFPEGYFNSKIKLIV